MDRDACGICIYPHGLFEILRHRGQSQLYMLSETTRDKKKEEQKDGVGFHFCPDSDGTWEGISRTIKLSYNQAQIYQFASRQFSR